MADKTTRRSTSSLIWPYTRILVAAALLVGSNAPSMNPVRYFYFYLLNLGGFFILASSLIHAKDAPRTLLVERLVNRIIMLGILLNLVGSLGDTTYLAIEKALSAQQQIAIALAALTASWILKITPWRSPIDDVPLTARAVEIPEADARVTAYHEAGHALFYAAFKTPPDNFTLHINKRMDAQMRAPQSLGTVGHMATLRMLHSDEYQVWSMLCKLGGLAAEVLVFDTMFDGSQIDIHHWQEAARNYLLGQPTGIFYYKPVSETEEAHNRNVMEQLKARHLRIAVRFMRLNERVLRDLGEHLLSMQEPHMDAKEIKPFWDRVVFPRDFVFPE